MNRLLDKIPLISRYCKSVEMTKGFSLDKKYCIHLPEGEKVLLRIFHKEEYHSKQVEYSMLEKLKACGVACAKPMEMGVIEDRGYMVTSYIEGQDAEEDIQTYSLQEQYDLGYRAGEELKRMHQIPAPAHISSWYKRKVDKHKNYINAYLACGIKITHDDKIMRFIDDHIHLMKQRPNLFQHDDFHLGNIIVNKREFAGVVDFNRYDWGDPIHEFLKVGMFTRQVSIPFSKGQIKGYFQNQEPDETFWTLYALYLAMCVFSTVVWTLRTVPDHLSDMLDKIDVVLDDHNYFASAKPKWYESVADTSQLK